MSAVYTLHIAYLWIASREGYDYFGLRVNVALQQNYK